MCVRVCCVCRVPEPVSPPQVLVQQRPVPPTPRVQPLRQASFVTPRSLTDAAPADWFMWGAGGAEALPFQRATRDLSSGTRPAGSSVLAPPTAVGGCETPLVWPRMTANRFKVVCSILGMLSIYGNNH